MKNYGPRDGKYSQQIAIYVSAFLLSHHRRSASGRSYVQDKSLAAITSTVGEQHLSILGRFRNSSADWLSIHMAVLRARFCQIVNCTAQKHKHWGR